MNGASASSATSSLGDAYESQQKDLRETADSFPVQSGQIGCIFFLDGEPVGGDWVSQPAAYKELHRKLVESQAMNVVVTPKSDSKAKPTVKSALGFLSDTFAGERTARAAVGLGHDLRHETENSLAVSLEHEGITLHAGVHRLEKKVHPRLRNQTDGLLRMIERLRSEIGGQEDLMQSMREDDPEGFEQYPHYRFFQARLERNRQNLVRMESYLQELTEAQSPEETEDQDL